MDILSLRGIYREESELCMQDASSLLELQQLDLQLLRERKALQELPVMEQIQQVRLKQRELARRTTKITGALKDSQTEAQEQLRRRQHVLERIAETKESLNECSEYRLVQQYNAELDRLAKRLEKLEYDQTGLDREVDRFASADKQAAELKVKLDTRENQLVEQFKEEASSIKETLKELVAHREALCETIDPGLLAQYESCANDHNHIGIGELKDGACTACGMVMQPVQLDDLRSGSDISRCPVCGRLIVVR